MSSNDKILKNESPWGPPPGGGRDDGNGSGQRKSPPNIDDIIRKAQGSVGRIFPGGAGGNKPIYLGLLVLVILFLGDAKGTLRTLKSVTLQLKLFFVLKHRFYFFVFSKSFFQRRVCSFH